MLYVPSTCCTDNISTIAEFVPNASEIFLSQTLLQPWFCLRAHPRQQVMVEHKHVLLHIPIRKSHMVSCLVILGAKSVVPSLWVPCVQSIVEGMFHLETDELGLCQSGGAPSCWEMKSSESSFSCGNSQSCSTLRYQFPLRVYINYQLDALTIIYS